MPGTTTTKTKAPKLENQIKKFLKNNDPENIEKRKKYSSDEKVKLRRKRLNELRRKMHSATVVLLQDTPLYDEDGNEYYVKHNRLVRKTTKGEKAIVIANRRTKELLYTPFEDELDLLDDNFKINCPEQEDNQMLYTAVKDLLEGKSDLEETIKQKKELKETEIPDEECYWKKLSEDQKEKLLQKLVKAEKERQETIVF